MTLKILEHPIVLNLHVHQFYFKKISKIKIAMFYNVGNEFLEFTHSDTNMEYLYEHLRRKILHRSSFYSFQNKVSLELIFSDIHIFVNTRKCVGTQDIDDISFYRIFDNRHENL